MKIHLYLISLALCSLGCQQRSEVESQVGSAANWQISGFEKADALNPLLGPGNELSFNCPLNENTVYWEERNVLNPTAVVRGDSIYLLYRAQDSMGTSRIGMAVSHDGLNFVKRPSPVFYPMDDHMRKYEWNYQKDGEQENSETCYFCYFDGVEDPRIVESEDGRYIMTYTAYDGKTARLAIASSEDMVNWTKHGLVLREEKYKDTWSKAGAIVARKEGERIVATRIDGKYWMYYGDTSLFMAWSDDLIHWEVAENAENGERIRVMNPRSGRFDSRLVEPGPYALLTSAGILMIYNGSNAANFNDPELPKFTYAAGQALFDKDRPYQLTDRSEGYFIHPDKDYERIGEVNEVCFVEGLVPFKGKWFLYYGTADSKIAAAVAPQ